MNSGAEKMLTIERVKQLLKTCAHYFDDKASEREVQNCVDDLLGAELVEPVSAELEATAAYYAGTLRRELAEKILLKLIEIAPAAFDTSSESPSGGVQLAWSIADAFLKHEGGNTP